MKKLIAIAIIGINFLFAINAPAEAVRQKNVIKGISCPFGKDAEFLQANVINEFDPKADFRSWHKIIDDPDHGYVINFRKKLTVYDDHGFKDYDFYLDNENIYLICVYSDKDFRVLGVKIPGKALGCHKNKSERDDYSCDTEVDSSFPKDWQPVASPLPKPPPPHVKRSFWDLLFNK